MFIVWFGKGDKRMSYRFATFKQMLIVGKLMLADGWIVYDPTKEVVLGAYGS